MIYRVVTETRAIRDIDEVTGWIAAQASDAAERWFNAIEAQINSLARFPERCPRAYEDGLFKYELRQLVFGRRHGRYRIIFTFHENAVRPGAEASPEIAGPIPALCCGDWLARFFVKWRKRLQNLLRKQLIHFSMPRDWL